MKLIERTPNTEGKKTACVSRYGAWGDAVLCSPIFRKLKEDGYYVIFNCSERCYEVQRHNPNVDAFLLQQTEEIPNTELPKYWEGLAKKYDRFINLSGSVEGRLLAVPWRQEYGWSKLQLHNAMNKNYMDTTMEVAGYPEAKGINPDLHFSEKEEKWVKEFRSSIKGFLVVYCLSGSSHHKTYPYADSVIQAIVEGIPEATVVLVGEAGCRGIIDPHPRILDKCGNLGIRKSFLLTREADLVISTETSIANASSAFDTPKIILLSHSSEENLTKYWKNCFTVFQPVSCYPCHKLHYSRKSCPLEETTNMPVCVALLHPAKILEKVEQVYAHWKSGVENEHTSTANAHNDSH